MRDMGHTLGEQRDTLTRREQKERTRVALLDAALRLLEGKSFGSLGLREVAREAGVVPTAFYRHFDSMEELGLALIEASFRTLRRMIRDARAEPLAFEHVIRSSVEILVQHVHAHELHFRFVARERLAACLCCVRRSARRSASSAASSRRTSRASRSSTDGARRTWACSRRCSSTRWSRPPRRSRRAGRPSAGRARLVRRAEKQLLLIALGVPAWRSAAG